MSTKAARGTKRTCQNSDCGERFYDLNHNPITCPICASAYVPVVVVPSTRGDRHAMKAPKPIINPVDVEKVADAPELIGDEAVVEDAEVGETAGADDTFLEEEEEDGGDMTNIIGGPVAEGEEEV